MEQDKKIYELEEKCQALQELAKRQSNVLDDIMRIITRNRDCFYGGEGL